MTWDFYEEGKEIILKEDKKDTPKKLLDGLDAKQRKRLKKVLQSAQPTEFFGKDFTQMGELIDVLKDLDLVKSDNKLKKKMKSMDDRNIDIVASATELRKDYELLYRQLRDLVYPQKKEKKVIKMTWDYYNIKKKDKPNLTHEQKKDVEKAKLLILSRIKELEKVISENPLPSQEFTKDLKSRMEKIMRNTFKGD